MPANGPCQYAPLNLAPQAHQVLYSVTMGNVGDILVDYGTSVEVVGDVVAVAPIVFTPRLWALL
jgi:hypothetical protein